MAAWKRGRGPLGRLAPLLGRRVADGKWSRGVPVEAPDVHAEARAFQAEGPAGAARMIRWPAGRGEGFHWAVDSKNRKGWHRFTEHHYRREAVERGASARRMSIGPGATVAPRRARPRARPR